MHWILAIVFPFAGALVSLFLLGKQWNKTDESSFKNLDLFGFPSNWSSYTEACQELITRKTMIWYSVFLVTSIAYFFSPAIGTLIEKIATLFFLFLIWGVYSGLRSSKKALRKINAPIDMSYRPVVNMFRISLVYMLFLLILYHLLISKAFYS